MRSRAPWPRSRSMTCARPTLPRRRPPRALFHTFDGLDVELAGRKDGTHALVIISARAASAPAQDEAQKISARTQGWEFEIPDYKYAALFTPLEDLLAKPPEAAKKAATPSPPNPALLGK